MARDRAAKRGAATCMATGQAAGVTAAMAAQHGSRTRDLDIRLVQRTLLEQDAILGLGARAKLFTL